MGLTDIYALHELDACLGPRVNPNQTLLAHDELASGVAPTERETQQGGAPCSVAMHTQLLSDSFASITVCLLHDI